MTRLLRRIDPRGRARALALLVGLVAMGPVAMAGADVPAHEPIVALAYGPGTHTLVKAYPNALFSSSDEGRDWTPIALPDVLQHGHIVSVSEQAQGVLYIAGPGLGVLRSADGGRTWAAKNDGLPSNDVIAVSSHADQPDTVYAVVSGHGIFRSEDAGRHWRLMDAGPRGAIRQFVHSNMPGSMQTGWFFAATAQGVGRSMDCFCGWRDAGGLGRAVSAVAYDPRQPSHVYAAAGNVVFRSVDGGEHWSQEQSPGRDITTLTVGPAGALYAATGDSALFRSVDSGRTWHRVDA